MADYRLAEKMDCKVIYELICSLEEEILNFEDFCSCYEINIKNDRIIYLVAVVNGVIEGFISVHINLLLHHAGMIAEIQELIVKSEYRGQKIGKELVKRAGEIASKKGCKQLEVCCNQRRERTYRFYEACGMKNSHYKFCMHLN